VPRPIRRILVSPDFERSFKRLPRRIQELFAKKEEWFKVDAFDARLGTHKLGSRLRGLWAFDINRQYRVLFEFVNDTTVLYHDVGTHEIYRR
jgi:mRNA-degrading endonuclease RelE of RelBE toxin-antitoxin system